MSGQLPRCRPGLSLPHELAVHGDQQIALAAAESWVRLDRLADTDASGLGGIGRHLTEQPAQAARFELEQSLEFARGVRPRCCETQLPQRHGAPR